MKIFTSFYFLMFLLIAHSVEAELRKIVLIETMPVPVVINHSKAIQNAFSSLQDKSDWTFELEVLKVEGSKEQAEELLEISLKRKRPDLVVTVATLATQAAKEILRGTNIPILFCVVADPVGSGIVSEVGVPNGENISGVLYTQLRETKLEMVMRLLGQQYHGSVVKFGVITSDYPSAVGELRELSEIASLMENVEFVPYVFPYKTVPLGLPEMHQNVHIGLEKLRGEVDFLWEVPCPLSELETYSKILIESKIPVILANTARSVELGAVMAVPTNYQETGSQIVEMAQMVFQGTDVGSLPVTIPRKFDLFLNLKVAARLGINVPSHLLMIAGEHIIH